MSKGRKIEGAETLQALKTGYHYQLNFSIEDRDRYVRMSPAQREHELNIFTTRFDREIPDIVRTSTEIAYNNLTQKYEYHIQFRKREFRDVDASTGGPTGAVGLIITLAMVSILVLSIGKSAQMVFEAAYELPYSDISTLTEDIGGQITMIIGLTLVGVVLWKYDDIIKAIAKGGVDSGV